MAHFIGTNGNDELHGGAEDDVIFGFKGADRMSGGEGVDTINYYDENTSINLDMAALHNKAASKGSTVGTASFGDSLEDYFHNLIGGNTDDYLRGNHLNNEIYGGYGNDTIIARAGDDYINGETGNDKIYGGEGADYLIGYLGNDKIYGGAGNDTIYGDFFGEFIEEVPIQYLQDILSGGAGNDKIYDDGGVNQMLSGGSGDDVVYSSDIDYQLNFKFKSKFNLVTGGAGNDRVFVMGSDSRAEGGTGDDVVSAFGINNIANGGAGDDEISVSEKNSVANGGMGNDTITVGGTGKYSDNGGNHIANGGEGDDVLISAPTYHSREMNYNNMLSGGNGNDILEGGDLATLVGGEGNDTFIVRYSGYIHEDYSEIYADPIREISDFQVGQDVLDLTATSGLALASLAVTHQGGNDYKLFHINDAMQFSVNVKTTGGVFTLTDITV